MRLFLGAHGAGFVLVGIIEAGFLIDLAAGFDDRDLAAGLDLDGLLDEAHGVHVLDLAAGAEMGEILCRLIFLVLARSADRDVHVGAHGARSACCRRRCRDSAGSGAACPDRRRLPRGRGCRGGETISISATPVRLRSTKDMLGSMSWIDLPASCSRWMRSIRTRRAVPGRPFRPAPRPRRRWGGKAG